MDGNEQWSKKVHLDNFGNDREQGGEDIYKGQPVARFFEGLNDLLDFYPEDDAGELQLHIKLNPGGSVGAAWNTDLVKLYFAADQGRETVLTCVAGHPLILDYPNNNDSTCRFNYPNSLLLQFSQVVNHDE